MLIIIPIFSLIVFIDFIMIKRSDNHKKNIVICSFFIFISFLISILINFKIKIPTPADFIEAILRSIGVVK